MFNRIETNDKTQNADGKDDEAINILSKTDKKKKSKVPKVELRKPKRNIKVAFGKVVELDSNGNEIGCLINSSRRS